MLRIDKTTNPILSCFIILTTCCIWLNNQISWLQAIMQQYCPTNLEWHVLKHTCMEPKSSQDCNNLLNKHTLRKEPNVIHCKNGRKGECVATCNIARRNVRYPMFHTTIKEETDFENYDARTINTDTSLSQPNYGMYSWIFLAKPIGIKYISKR